MYSILQKHFEEGKLAHAYFLTGPKNTVLRSVYEFANFFFGNNKEASSSSNPDFFEYLGGKFSIDDAHNIRRQALMKGFSGKGKLFLIDADSLTYEAAPALLKIFEEPPFKTHFFLIAERPYNLPLTLRSRLRVLNFGGDYALSDIKKDSVQKFLKMPPYKRLLYLQDIAEDRARSLSFLRALEIVAFASFEKQAKEKNNFSGAAFVKEIGECEALLSERASSPRIILEHIALTLPKIS